MYPGRGNWIDDTETNGLLVVYACFGDHCSPTSDSQLCSLGDGAGCCKVGRHGLLCETCEAGYTKQNDHCRECEGAAAHKILAEILVKTGLTTLVVIKLLEKAMTRSYTATTSFATVIFTAQTIGLAVSDSYSRMLRAEAPMMYSFLNYAQSMMNPDTEAPEQCFFGNSLISKLFVNAILPPLFALFVLTVIYIPWHFCKFSWGLRWLCHKKRALADKIQTLWRAKKLTVRWQGEQLLDGTYAIVKQQKLDKARSTRTIPLADCEAGQVWLAANTIAAPQPSDFDTLSVRELRRLLRGFNISTDGHDDEDSLLKRIRFHTECDDMLFDKTLLPTKFKAFQFQQAIMHTLILYYAPCTR